MQGFPKHLNTKQDYLNTLKVMPEETKAALQEVFDARLTWQPVKKLAADETPSLTAKKKIVELPADSMAGPEGGDQEMERWLYELKEDENAWFFKLGFTVTEAKNLLR